MHRSKVALVLTSLVAFGCAIRQPPETPPPPPVASPTPLDVVPSDRPVAAPVEAPAPSAKNPEATREQPTLKTENPKLSAPDTGAAQKPVPTTLQEADDAWTPEKPMAPSPPRKTRGDDGKPDAPFAPSAATVTGGISKEILARALLAHVMELRACYQALLEKSPDAKGLMTIDLTVGPKGDVSNAKVKLAPDSVDSAACVLRVMQKLQFPPSAKGGDVHVSYPFALTGG